MDMLQDSNQSYGGWKGYVYENLVDKSDDWSLFSLLGSSASSSSEGISSLGCVTSLS